MLWDYIRSVFTQFLLIRMGLIEHTYTHTPCAHHTRHRTKSKSHGRILAACNLITQSYLASLMKFWLAPWFAFGTFARSSQLTINGQQLAPAKMAFVWPVREPRAANTRTKPHLWRFYTAIFQSRAIYHYGRRSGRRLNFTLKLPEPAISPLDACICCWFCVFRIFRIGDACERCECERIRALNQIIIAAVVYNKQPWKDSRCCSFFHDLFHVFNEITNAKEYSGLHACRAHQRQASIYGRTGRARRLIIIEQTAFHLFYNILSSGAFSLSFPVRSERCGLSRWRRG